MNVGSVRMKLPIKAFNLIPVDIYLLTVLHHTDYIQWNYVYV